MTTPFATMSLPQEPDATAPDGSAVRVLLTLSGGSMAHFELPAGAISTAVRHRTVEEIWYVVGGRGQMWRHTGDPASGELVDLTPGVCLTTPLGTTFQFLADDDGPLSAVGVTLPPWPPCLSGSRETKRRTSATGSATRSSA
jgi:mannose-6-phosphate isomerase-like protein (cupin superfamily)